MQINLATFPDKAVVTWDDDDPPSLDIIILTNNLSKTSNKYWAWTVRSQTGSEDSTRMKLIFLLVLALVAVAAAKPGGKVCTYTVAIDREMFERMKYLCILIEFGLHVKI